MAFEQQIVKSFETVPSYELVKQNIINLIMQTTTNLGDMNKYQLLGRNDRMTKLGFTSNVLTLYSLVRPKMIDHADRKSDKELKQFIGVMDQFMFKPSTFKTTYAILAFTEINSFCEKYRITSTTIYRSPLENRSFGGDAAL